ncbi:MAG: GNAT family N-acetyltransferase [Candidatus Heimdallarchaeaceae archaeon]
MSEDVKIRNYKESDNALCQKMWIELTEYHQEIYDDPSIGGENLAQGFNDHLEQYGGESFWVAEEDEKIIGLIGLIVRGKAAEVEPIIIKSSHRKKGIGKKLLQFIINHASEKEIKYLSIRPVARNKNALKLFYEMGFNIIGHIELFMNLKEKESKKWKTGIEIHDIPFEY